MGWGCLRGVLGCFGWVWGVLGLLWVRFELFGSAWRCFGGVLGRVWAVLGGLWVGFGLLWGPFRGMAPRGRPHSFWLRPAWLLGWKSLTMMPSCRMFSTNFSRCSSSESNFSDIAMAAPAAAAAAPPPLPAHRACAGAGREGGRGGRGRGGGGAQDGGCLSGCAGLPLRLIKHLIKQSAGCLYRTIGRCFASCPGSQHCAGSLRNPPAQWPFVIYCGVFIALPTHRFHSWRKMSARQK